MPYTLHHGVGGLGTATRHLTAPVHDWLDRHRGLAPGRGTGTVRRRRPHDVAACARLLRVVFCESHYPAHWPESRRSWLDGEDVLDAWVAERDGEVLGHVAAARVGRDPLSALRWRETTGHRPDELAGVDRFFVRPRVRGQGVGTALLAVALQGVRDRGLVPVLETVSPSRHGVRLVEDRGWRLIAMDHWGPPSEHLLMYRYAAPPGTGGAR